MPPLPGSGPLSLERIARATHEIDPVFLNSPQYESDALGAQLNRRIVIKVETVNPIRSFKGRGTDFFIRELTPVPERLVCASAGNFGQGMARAARRRGITCEIFASVHANPYKVERMRALGAEVHQAGHDFDEAKDHARRHAEEIGAAFVEDGREPAIAEGAGTISVELCRWPEPLVTVVVPLGNGALLGGMGCWIKATSPSTRVVGVCAEEAPAMERSWRTGQIVETERADTIADGIATRVPVPEALEYLRDAVDDIVLVSEGRLRQAVRLLLETTGLVVEPAGAAGVAALLQHPALGAEGLTATVLCGGNA